jgi:beta-lactamase class C
MKRKYFILAGIVLMLLPLLLVKYFFFNTASPQPIKLFNKNRKVEPNPHVTHLIDDYERELELLQLFSKTPGAAIAIVKDSTIVYMKGFGVREIGKKDLVDVNTVFRIASVSKCFASFLTGVLVEEKKLAWDDRVVKYVPGFSLSSAEETQKLTLRHVLSHSTGLPFHAYTNLVEDGHTLEEMLSRLKDVPLNGKVGEIYSYQNVAYSLIGEAIKSATGKSYEAWMVEKVFGPLDMENASIDYASIMMNKNVAKPHLSQRKGWRKAKITDTYYNVSPAGGINASISDMAKWMVALLGYRPDVIHRATLDTLFSPEIKAPSKNRNYGRRHRLSDSYYGLGWRILHYPDDTLVYHGGYVNGFRSEVAVSQKDRVAICILANAPGELPDNGIPIFFDLLKKYRGEIALWDRRYHEKLARQSGR